MSRRTRREFLEDSMFAAALAAAAGPATSVFAADEKAPTSAGDKLSVCCIGVNGRGNSHIGAFAGRDDTEITWICDVDERVGNNRADQIAKRQSRRPQFAKDLRKVFEDKSVDIVTIATPNHWHALAAIWAIQAGKDVYVEKPVSHNVSEGARIVDAARKHNRICQTGTQSRSNPGMREAIQYLHDGKLGPVKLARGLCYKRRGSIGPKGMYEVPEYIDYNLWCGPAPMDPLTRPRLHYDWHWVWATGCGDLGNQGIHQMDISRWGLGQDQLAGKVISYGGRLGYEPNEAGETANTQVVICDYGDQTLVFETRGLNTKDYRGAKIGVIFEGDDGFMVVPTYSSATVFDKAGNKVTSFNGGGDQHHYQNFLQAVRSRKHTDLNADIHEGHLSSALCHLGNVSLRTGQEASPDDIVERLGSVKTNDDDNETFERTKAHLADNKVDVTKTRLTLGRQLTIDPKTETIPGDSAASALLTRDYRKPFVVPSKADV